MVQDVVMEGDLKFLVISMGICKAALHAGQLFIVALGAPLHPDAKATGEKDEDCQATEE
jgi:hypothetical protein